MISLLIEVVSEKTNQQYRMMLKNLFLINSLYKNLPALINLFNKIIYFYWGH